MAFLGLSPRATRDLLCIVGGGFWAFGLTDFFWGFHEIGFAVGEMLVGLFCIIAAARTKEQEAS